MVHAKAPSPVLSQDSKLDKSRWTRDTAAKGEPPESARESKFHTKTADVFPVHNLRTLLRNWGRAAETLGGAGGGKGTIRLVRLTEVLPFQQHLRDLLELIP